MESFQNHVLFWRDSNTCYRLSFLVEEPLIAPVIANDELFWRDSSLKRFAEEITMSHVKYYVTII